MSLVPLVAQSPKVCATSSEAGAATLLSNRQTSRHLPTVRSQAIASVRDLRFASGLDIEAEAL